MFDWLTKTAMTETIIDEICKTICIMSALIMIALIGYIVDKLEQKHKNRRK